MADLVLTELNALPPGFLEVSATELHHLLPPLTLIHLPGQRTQPLFVSILLHGNETTGLLALQKVLRRYVESPLPRSLSLSVGNVSAAAQGLRRLDEQPDYNRIWDDQADNEESAVAQEILARISARKPIAAVDIHNNSGTNPNYACINRLDDAFVALAGMFSNRVVWFTEPSGVLSMACSRLCPSLTIECGRPGELRGVTAAADLLDRILRSEALPPLPSQDCQLLHTTATITVPEHSSFSFDGTSADIRFLHDLDQHNFMELPAGFVIAHVDAEPMLRVQAVNGGEIAGDCFEIAHGCLRTRRPLIPAMITTDTRVVRQDCLCYLMERLDR